MENLIKWSKKDYSELRKTVNQFNRRVRELESYGREVVPEEVTYKDIKANIYTRKEFNRKLNELRRLQNRHEADVVRLASGEEITKWEFKNLKTSITRASNRLQAELISEENSLTPSNKRINEIKSTIESFNKLEEVTGKAFTKLRTRILTLGVSDYDMKKAKIFQDNFIRVYKKLHRKEIVEWAKKYNNPQKFWNDIKDSTLVDLEERYDIEGGVIKVLGGKDDSYYFELDKLGIEYTLPKKLQNKKK